MRGKAKVKIPLQVERRLCHEVPPALEKLTNVGFMSQAFREHNRVQGMKFQFEFGHDSKVAAAPAQSPEQICIFFCAGAQDGLVSNHENKTFDIVTRQTEPAREPACSTTKNESRSAGVGDDS